MEKYQLLSKQFTYTCTYFMYILNMLLLFRRTQKEQAEHNKHQVKEKEDIATPMTHQLPQQKPEPTPPSIQTPLPAVVIDDPNDDISPGISMVTPHQSHKTRGRPCKYLIPPTKDDKPVNVSKAEMLRWEKKYNTAMWRYSKLTSDDADAYRESENACVKRSITMMMLTCYNAT